MTIAGDQQQIVVEHETSGNDVEQAATFDDAHVIESITEMATPVDVSQLGVTQVVASGTYTLANTTSEVQVVSTRQGASEMDAAGAGPQITLLAIDTGEVGASHQTRALHESGDTDPDVINQCWFSPKDDKDNPQGKVVCRDVGVWMVRFLDFDVWYVWHL